MGGVLHVPPDAELTVTVSVTGVPGGRVALLANGGPRKAAAVTTDDRGGIEATFELRGGGPAWVRAEALDAGNRPVLLSNPVFLDR
jgi:hypothetical protein